LKSFKASKFDLKFSLTSVFLHSLMSVKKNTRQGGFFASAKKDTHQRASLSSVFLFTLGKEASLTSVLLALRKELFLPSARKKNTRQTI
jgi:hypothetical protein